MNQAESQKSSNQFFLLRRWLFCNIVGFILSLALMIPMEFAADPNRYVWLLGLIFGVVLSPWQAIALKRLFPKLKYWQWIAANIVGMYGAIAINIWLQNQLAYVFNPLLELGRYGAVIGLCGGASQLFILGLRSKKACFWWLANILAWAIAVPISSLMAFLLFLEPLDDLTTTISVVTMAIAAISIGLLMGLIYTGITAFALVAIAPSSQEYSQKKEGS